MIIKIIRRDKPFTLIDNDIANDRRISFKAKGILLCLLSRPVHWIARVADLEKRSTDGRQKVLSGMRELKEFGYAKIETVRSKNGKRLVGRQWVISEVPAPAVENADEAAGNVANKGDSLSNLFPVRQETCRTGNRPHSNMGVRLSAEAKASATIFLEGTEYSPFVRKACHVLEDFIRSTRRFGRRFNRVRWYKDMGLLLQDIGGDKERLKKVLRAYVTSPRNKFTPQADSAGSFREKFLRIENWLRANDGNGAMSPRKIRAFTTKKAFAAAAKEGDITVEIDEIPE